MAFLSFNLNLPNADGEITVEMGRSRVEATKGLFFDLKTTSESMVFYKEKAT